MGNQDSCLKKRGNGRIELRRRKGSLLIGGENLLCGCFGLMISTPQKANWTDWVGFDRGVCDNSERFGFMIIEVEKLSVFPSRYSRALVVRTNPGLQDQ